MRLSRERIIKAKRRALSWARAAWKRAEEMLSSIQNRMANLVNRRRMAYRRVFLDGQGGLTRDGQIILAHLAKLCRATNTKGIVSQSTVGAAVDVNATMIAIGKHEVFQAIMKELHIDLGRVYQVVQEEDALAH